MILRKVSNLRPGDVIKMWSNVQVTIDSIKWNNENDKVIITTLEAGTRKLSWDDLVEIVIL